jgi:uncharacterized protein (TIGR02594 family)
MIIRFLGAAMLCAISSCSANPALAHPVPICDNVDIMRPCQAETRSQPRRHVTAPRTARRSPPQRTHQRAPQAFGSISGSNLVERARAYLGRSGPSLGLPARLWCADFINMVTGGGTGSRVAKSWLSHQHVSAQIGAIVVTGRRGGGHVGIVSGFTSAGDVIVVSGNHGHRVGEGVYSRSRVIAFVSPG